MGLGKTIQVLALLLYRKREADTGSGDDNGSGAPSSARPPRLLVVPASLIANWKSEIARFAPTLSAIVAPPSEMPGELEHGAPPAATACDLVITTYGMLARLGW